MKISYSNSPEMWKNLTISIKMSEVLDLQHLLQENHTLRWDRNFYKSLLERATAREQLLKQEIQQPLGSVTESGFQDTIIGM